MRAPVTTLVLASMLVCAGVTNTIGSRLSPEALQRLGCAPADLLSSRAWCTITSLPFTWGGFSFLGLLPLAVASLWLCERTFGSRLTAAIFLGTHVFAGLAQALALESLSPLLGAGVASGLLTARDVGPSAGCFGCVGALIARLEPRQQALSAVGVALFLVAISFWRPDPGFASATLWVSDLSHPTAALAGFAYVRVCRPTPRLPTAV
jgi:hypothetical protein